MTHPLASENTIESLASDDCTDRSYDAAIVHALRMRDQDAAEAFAKRFYPRMYAAAFRLLRNEHDAQDAVQDAFVSAIAHIDGFRGSSSLATWLLRIVVNAALMKRRSSKRRQTISLDDHLPTFAPDGHRLNVHPGGAFADGEAECINEELRQSVRACMDLLPDSHRTVLLLRDVEDLSTAETAEVLGIEPGAVKVRLHRARMALRQMLEESYISR